MYTNKFGERIFHLHGILTSPRVFFFFIWIISSRKFRLKRPNLPPDTYYYRAKIFFLCEEDERKTKENNNNNFFFSLVVGQDEL